VIIYKDFYYYKEPGILHCPLKLKININNITKESDLRTSGQTQSAPHNIPSFHVFAKHIHKSAKNLPSRL